MLELAVGGNSALLVSRLEARPRRLNYTVDTLEELAAEDARRELLLLLGADSLHDLPNWRDPARICQLAMPAVVCRAGQESIFRRWRGWSMPSGSRVPRASGRDAAVDLSSRELRSLVSQGHSIRYRLPRAVEMYIRSHGLYGAGKQA